MKRLFLMVAIFTAALTTSDLLAQNPNENNYIEVHGKAEKTVKPDKITLSISINERNYRDRSLEQLELDMVKALRSEGIDVAKKLKARDLTSNFKKEKAKNQTALLAKSYTLELSDASTSTNVITDLGEIGISNVFIEKVEFAAMDSLKLAIKADAVKNAKDIAVTMAEVLDQKVGKAFFIYEQEENVSNFKSNGMMITRAMMVDSIAAEEILPEIDFQDIKVTSRVTVRFQLL